MVLIVFLQQEVDVFVNQPFYVPHGVGRNATVSGQSNRFQPELALSVCAAHVDVRRLGALVRVKVETKTADSEPCGRRAAYCRRETQASLAAAADKGDSHENWAGRMFLSRPILDRTLAFVGA
jgi:hypothetical protein